MRALHFRRPEQDERVERSFRLAEEADRHAERVERKVERLRGLRAQANLERLRREGRGA
jgi:hypothetical protein